MSTYVSSFRLHTAGVEANHFALVFLVDASSAMEPGVLTAALVNFVGKNTVIVVTGSSSNFPRRVHSDMAQYFDRLLKREPYLSWDPAFVTHLEQIRLKLITVVGCLGVWSFDLTTTGIQQVSEATRIAFEHQQFQ